MDLFKKLIVSAFFLLIIFSGFSGLIHQKAYAFLPTDDPAPTSTPQPNNTTACGPTITLPNGYPPPNNTNTLVYDLRIKNNCKTQKTFALSVTNKLGGWDYTFRNSANTTNLTSVTAQGLGTIDFKLKVSHASNADVKIYHFMVKADAGANATSTKELTFIVTQLGSPSPSPSSNPNCTYNNPTVKIVDLMSAASSSKTVHSGVNEGWTFNIKVDNNNTGSGCGDTQFKLSTSPANPSNWQTLVEPSDTLSLAVSHHGNFTYTLNPRCHAASTTFTVTVETVGHSNKKANVTIKYNVDNPNICPTPTPSGSPSPSPSILPSPSPSSTPPTGCQRNTPTLTAEPTQQDNVNPGATKHYKLTFTNNDQGCQPSTFDFSATGPNNNWHFSFDPTNINIGSEVSFPTADLSVTSPAGAGKGEKTITVKAKDRAHGGRSTQATVRYCVNQPCPSAAPTPTPSPGSAVALNFVVGLDGIGKTGDNTTPNIDEGNHNPQPQSIRTKTLKVEMFDADDNNRALSPINVTVKYQTEGANSGSYVNEQPYPAPSDMNLTHTHYIIKLSVPGYLRREVGKATNQSIQTIDILHSPYNVPRTVLVTGDVNHDGHLNSLDYNIIISCSIYAFNAGACSNKLDADLNANDGVVNSDDLTYFLREHQVQNGD